MTPAKRPLVQSHARAAYALAHLAVLLAWSVSVPRVEPVPAAAVSLSGIGRSPGGTTQGVDLHSHGLEVARVEARTIPADVIRLQSPGDRSDESLVRDLVDLPSLVVDANAPVAVDVAIARPWPALICRQVRNARESFLEGEAVAVRTAFLASNTHASIYQTVRTPA